ncbi:MAG: L-arabinose isomerase, partial [Oscillospiraceae bacterium]|nr:L-arabinose isomerase [Oscillospiraceae bacterium]
AFSKNLVIVRFGDNMRQVAVTEGDKVEAQIKLGWQVNTIAVGDLAEEMDKVTDAEIDSLVAEYRSQYDMDDKDIETIRYQAREEIAIEKILVREGAKAFTNTFEDLHGMKQLPGLATQHLLSKGYGYGAEGDWKTAGLVAIFKAMYPECPTAFMEDYCYDYEQGLILGAHMLEVCPTIAATKPRIEVHHLGIGGKEPPARLVFEGRAGSANAVSLVDVGGRMRLIAQAVECVKPTKTLPNLPVARAMWKPAPDLETGATNWLIAGGAHHTALTFGASESDIRDLARILGIELVRLDENTRPDQLEKELMLGDLIWNK